MTAAILRMAPFNPAMRGHHAVYRAGQTNFCPGCGRTQWLIGRMLAECAFCSTAMPLEASLQARPSATIVHRGGAPDPWPVPSCEMPRVVRRGKA